MAAAYPSMPVSAHASLAPPALPLRRSRQAHPKNFYLLCLTVLGERLAAYMLASSAVLMLGERYGYSRADSLRFAGQITALSYLGTLPGGLLADRVFGHQRALRISTVLLALGYAALTLPTALALFVALGFLLMGGALFKPSTQGIIAHLYPSSAGDTRLGAAQIGFYIAVNVGAAIGALTAGLFVRHGGWSSIFAIAAAVMLACRVGLAVRWESLRTPPRPPPLTRAATSEAREFGVVRRAIMIFVLTLAMLLYTVCYGQVDGSLLLFARDHTDRIIYGFEVPAPWFVALPALLVLVLAPVQLALMGRLQRWIGMYKLVAVGLVATALAFVVLMLATLFGSAHRVSMGWLVACLSLLVVGELLVAPLGLSLLIRLAPFRFIGVITGVWYISGALGYWLAGEIGALWVRWPPLCILALLVALPFSGAVCLWISNPRRTSA